MKKIVQIIGSVILGMLLSSIPCMAGNEGYITGASSKDIIVPNLNLNRINTGSYIAPAKKEKITPGEKKETTPVKKETPKRRRWFWRKKEVKKEPTPAEIAKSTAETALEVSKKLNEVVKIAKATAETALEVSKKAEKIAVDALNRAKRAESIADKSIAATNRAIETTNKAVATTNKAIGEINRLAEKLRREREEEKRKKRVETYRVKRGDSLGRIALKIYKDASLWRKLFNANRDKIKKPNLVYPGQILKVPR